MIVSTKADKNSAPKQTNLSIVFDSPQAERALATQALVVKLQGIWRQKGIPDTFEAKLSDYAPGTRHGGMSLQDAVKSLSPEEKQKLMAELKAALGQ